MEQLGAVKATISEDIRRRVDEPEREMTDRSGLEERIRSEIYDRLQHSMQDICTGSREGLRQDMQGLEERLKAELAAGVASARASVEEVRTQVASRDDSAAKQEDQRDRMLQLAEGFVQLEKCV